MLQYPSKNILVYNKHTSCYYLAHGLIGTLPVINPPTDETVEGNCTQGDIRISDDSFTSGQHQETGREFAQGRVEICINNAWGTICRDSYFDSVDAGVLCQQLGGYSREPVEVYSNSSGSGPIFLDRLGCSSDDLTLLDCQLSSPLGIADRSCDHSNDVSVQCFGILILLNIILYLQNQVDT